MSRPQPTILTSYNEGHNTHSIIATKNIVYCVGYRNNIVSAKITNQLTSRILYPNMLASHKGHIERICRKLNKKLNTTDFHVIELTHKEE